MLDFTFKTFEQRISFEEWRIKLAWPHLCIPYVSRHVMCFVWHKEIAADDKGTSCVSVCGLALSVWNLL
jgi:hypothetical protein